MSSRTPREVMPLLDHLVDAQVVGAEAGHRVGGKVVVQLVLVVDVRQRVPLRGGLQRHDDHVVVEAHRPGLRVAAQLHRTGILQPLRPVLEQACSASPPSMVITCVGFCRYLNAPCGPDDPKSTPSGNTLPCRDQGRGLRHLIGGDEVQRAQFVGVTPPAPVADVVGDPAEVTHAGHDVQPFSKSAAWRAARLPPSTQMTCPVMYPAARLPRNASTAACSAGFDTRPSGLGMVSR